MQHKIRYESDLLYVRVEGRFSLEEAKRGFIEILDSVAQCQADKILFDGLGIEGKPEFIERFEYAEFVARKTYEFLMEHEKLQAPRIAYVLVEPVGDPNRFGETVALNRGLIVKTFDTLPDALEWLNRPHSA